MRVLMLGWEFPPHISGGLGTACHGIAQGLTRAGVEVVFVVPRVRGDEAAGATRIVGANEIAVNVPRQIAARGAVNVPRQTAAGGASDAKRDAHPEGPVVTRRVEPIAVPKGVRNQVVGEGPRVSETARTIAIDSLLAPYLDAAAYREVLLARARAQREAAMRSSAPLVSTMPGSETRAAIPPTPEPEQPEAPPSQTTNHPPDAQPAPTRLLEFSGAYGPDLLAEVTRYALAVEALARRERFDVVHAHDWMSVPAGVAAARASGKPLVYHVHACEHDRSPARPDTRVERIEQLGLDQCDRVVCVSHFTATVLQRHYRVDEAKVRVVHNALTQSEQRQRAHVERTIDAPLVLFLGRVTAQKGPEFFLEAAARVVRVRPDVKFVVAGAGDRLAETIERAARLGLARNVHFTGFLRGEEVERMYALADVYVMPSVSEPFGIAPLEAMALDVPVIVSRQSGVAEVLRNALKVDHWDVAGIADKILAVLTYPALARELQEEGRAEALALRWDAPASKLRETYRELARSELAAGTVS